MEAQRSRSRLGAVGRPVAAGVGGALLTLLVLWLFYRSGDPLVAPTLTRLFQAVASEWMQVDGWTGRSINFNQGAPRDALFPPVLLVALWVGFSSLLSALIAPPWRGFKSLAPYAVFLLLGWLALDLRWQWALSQRLSQTAATYAGLDQTARYLAGPDRRLYPFLREVLHHLPEPPARVFIVSADPGGANAGRVRYHLFPHNVSLPSATLPGDTKARAGDYVLLLSPMKPVRYDRDHGVLISKDGQRPADLLHAAAQGALFRLREGP
jgi:hypothetical protein